MPEPIGPNPLDGLGPMLFPPDTVLGNAERRARLAKSMEHVVEITAILAVATKLIPGPAGKAIGGLLAGLVKDPNTGKVRPGEYAPGNFLPSPFGFLDPTSVGLKRNFYLPEGATEYVPIIVDQIGMGLPEQREIDDRAAARERDQRILGFMRQLEFENDNTINDLAAGRAGFTRAGEIRAFAARGISFNEVNSAAQGERERRDKLRAAQSPVAAQIDPLLNSDGTPGEEIMRAVHELTAELAVDAVTSAATAIDRLFAANPPDP